MRILRVALVAAALALTGCAGDTSAPAETSATETPTTAPATPAAPTTTSAAPTTPSPSPTTTDTVDPILPTDCATLATEPTRQEAIGDLTLQSNGEGFVRPVPETNTLVLGCDWIVGDSTGMLLLISTVDGIEAVAAALEDLPGEGYTCQYSHDLAADFCQKPGAAPDTEELIVARDRVWVYLSTSNRNGRAFLAEIVEGIFA